MRKREKRGGRKERERRGGRKERKSERDRERKVVGRRERKREKEMFYLTKGSIHFISGYLVSNLGLWTNQIIREETRYRNFIG